MLVYFRVWVTIVGEDESRNAIAFRHDIEEEKKEGRKEKVFPRVSEEWRGTRRK